MSAPCPSLWIRAKAQNVSCRNSLQWPVYIINSVNLTKLLCYTPPLIQLHSFFRNVPHLWLINWLIDYLTDWPLIDWLIDWLSESLYVCNKLNTPWKVCLYGTCIYAPIGLSQKSCLFLALSFSISVITNTCVNSIQREILFCILYMYVHVNLFWEFNSLKNMQGLERTTKH